MGDTLINGMHGRAMEQGECTNLPPQQFSPFAEDFKQAPPKKQSIVPAHIFILFPPPFAEQTREKMVEVARSEISPSPFQSSSPSFFAAFLAK